MHPPPASSLFQCHNIFTHCTREQKRRQKDLACSAPQGKTTPRPGQRLRTGQRMTSQNSPFQNFDLKSYTFCDIHHARKQRTKGARAPTSARSKRHHISTMTNRHRTWTGQHNNEHAPNLDRLEQAPHLDQRHPALFQAEAKFFTKIQPTGTQSTAPRCTGGEGSEEHSGTTRNNP